MDLTLEAEPVSEPCRAEKNARKAEGEEVERTLPARVIWLAKTD